MVTTLGSLIVYAQIDIPITPLMPLIIIATNALSRIFETSWPNMHNLTTQNAPANWDTLINFLSSVPYHLASL